MDLALRFDRGIWTILGSASVYVLSQASREVIEVLEAAGSPLRPKEIAELLGIPVATIRKRLLDKKQRGEVSDTGKGYTVNAGNGGNGSNAGNVGSQANVCAHEQTQHLLTDDEMILGKEDEGRARGEQVKPIQANSFTAEIRVTPITDVTSVTCVTSLCKHCDSRDAVVESTSTPTHVDDADLDASVSGMLVTRCGSSRETDAPSIAMPSNELPTACAICGAEVERYSPAGIAYCAEHFPREEMPPGAAMTKEQFLGIVERIAAVFPGGCMVHVDSPGYTRA